MTRAFVTKGFVTRAEAGLIKPRSVSHNISPSGSVIHWAGTPQRISSHADCAVRWRSFQKHHLGKGWADIAYSAGFCQHGYVFAGRGKGVRSAANGTDEANYKRYAFCWIGGEGETPTRAAMNAMWWLVYNFNKSNVEPHSFWRSTQCCGDDLRGEIKLGLPKGSGMATDHDHELTEMPDWGGAERRYWDRFVADKVTTVPDSWKLSMHRLDLAWYHSEVVVPLRAEVNKLKSQISELRSELASHKAGHVTGDVSGDTPEHTHELGNTGKVVR